MTVERPAEQNSGVLREESRWLKELREQLIADIPNLVDHLYKNEEMATVMDQLAGNLDRVWALGVRVGRSSTKLGLSKALFAAIMHRYYGKTGIVEECQIPIGGLDTKKEEDDSMAAMPCAIAGPKAYDDTGGLITKNILVVSGGRAVFDRKKDPFGIESETYTGSHLPIFLSFADDVVMSIRHPMYGYPIDFYNKLKAGDNLEQIKALHLQNFSNIGEWEEYGRVSIDCINAEAAFAFAYGQTRQDGRGILTQITRPYHFRLAKPELIERLGISPNASMGFDLLHPWVRRNMVSINQETGEEATLSDSRHHFKFMAFAMAKLGCPLERIPALYQSLPYLLGEGRNIDTGNVILKGTEVDGGHWLDLSNKGGTYQRMIDRALW